MNRVASVVAAGGVLLALGACATGPGSGPAGRPSPAAGATPASVSVSPVPAVPGKVAVVTLAAVVRLDAIVTAVVVNGTDRPIYAHDSKTDCTIAYLQRWDGGGWRDMTGCTLRRMPATATVAPGARWALVFNPRSAHLANATGASSTLGRGRYRVRFSYRLDAGSNGTENLVAYSEPFQIR